GSRQAPVPWKATAPGLCDARRTVQGDPPRPNAGVPGAACRPSPRTSPGRPPPWRRPGQPRRSPGVRPGPVESPRHPRGPIHRPRARCVPAWARRTDPTLPSPRPRPNGDRRPSPRPAAHPVFPQCSISRVECRSCSAGFRPAPPPELQRMGLDHVSTGKNPPDEINVIIEIPKDAEPVKYEVDKESGAIFVDRVLSTPMRYPCNYGYVPNTLCGDGDPA